MSIELAVALISGIVAVASAVLTAVLGSWAAKGRLQLQAEIERQQAMLHKHEERQDLMNRIRDPVLWAAFDLQSRLFTSLLMASCPHIYHVDQQGSACTLNVILCSFSGSI